MEEIPVMPGKCGSEFLRISSPIFNRNVGGNIWHLGGIRVNKLSDLYSLVDRACYEDNKKHYDNESNCNHNTDERAVVESS